MPADSSTSQKAQPAEGAPEQEKLPASERSPSPRDQGRTKAICLILFVAVAATYFCSLRNGFVNYDDDIYVTANSNVQQGMTLKSIGWAFTNFDASNWHPLTWLSHLIDVQIFGLTPWGHHLTSLLLHAINTVLLFLLLNQLTGALSRSAIVAALFGLHPLHVESVVWVAERKDVLSTLFWLLTMMAYVRYANELKVQSSKFKVHYGLSLLWFACGVMSKPMVVTLPFVLLLLDYWPLQRICDLRFTIYESSQKPEASSEPDALGAAQTGGRKAGIGGLILEKVPFFVLAAVGSAVTFLVQNNQGATKVMSIPFSARAQNAAVSYCRYLGKLFYPLNLHVAYPHPEHWPAITVILACLLLASISGVVILLRRTQPYLAVGWFWFVGALVPVIGLVQVGDRAMADRYSYIPSIGFFIMLVWAVGVLAAKRPVATIGVSTAITIALATCVGLTVRQTGYWRDSGRLFRHSIALTKNNWLAYNNLGFWLLGNGQPEEGIAQYRKAIEANPNYALAHNNLAAALEGKGQTNAAITEYRAAIQAKPDYANAYYNLALLLQRNGRMDEAIDLYQKAINAQSDDVDAHNNLAIVLYQKGRIDDAIHQLQLVVKLRPDYSGGRCNLGNMLLKQGRADEAFAQFLEAVRLDPDNAVAHQNLANIYAQQGNAVEAAHHYQEALRLTPTGPR